MLRGIFFEDFQGFKGQNSCRLAPITLIFGPNASGKSSFARAIKLLKVLHGNKYESNEKLVQRSQSEATLAFGWSATEAKANSFTLGLTLSNSDELVAGVSAEPFKQEVQSAEFRLSLATSLNQYSMSQTITFLPSKTPVFLERFVFSIPLADLTDELLAELKKNLEMVLERLKEFEGPSDFQHQSKAQETPDEESRNIVISAQDLERRFSQREKSRSFEEEQIEWFNSNQNIVTFNASSLWGANFKNYVLAALLNLEYLGSKGSFPEPIREFQQIKFDSSTDVLQVNSWHEVLNEDEPGFDYVHLTEENSEFGKGEEIDLSVDENVLDNLLPLIYRNGMLFRYSKAVQYEADPITGEDPYNYQDWGAEGDELYAFDSAVAFHRNSESLWLELENAKFIEGWRGIPTRQSGPNQLSTVSKPVIDSVNAELARLTDGRYQYLVNRVDALRPEMSATDPKIRDLYTNVEIPFTEAGTGLSQILPILLDLYDPEREGLTFIEEPELHLHPKLQADLMDSIVNRCVLNDDESSQRQFILETHSESMLLRLQKRIRNGDIAKDDVCVLYVEAVNPAYSEDGKGFNRITELSLDHFGDVIDPFPISFVDLRLSDLL